MKNLLQRETYIAVHAQSIKFRAIKWIILICITYCIYLWLGWDGVAAWIALGTLLGLSIHFLFRWKTRGWTKPWGPMKKIIKTPFDK
jgi:O-antigen/teichoic acid export membrane protein